MLHQLPTKAHKTTPELLIIADLQVNSAVCGWLFAAEVSMRKAATGRMYLELKLRDVRGNEITARHFDLPRSDVQMPQEGKVVLIEGLVEMYRNALQMKLSRVETDETIPADLFIVSTRCPIAQLEADFEHLIDKVDHAGLSELLRRCFSSETMEKFRRWPAAMRHHGAVVGGLLEHTVNVTTIAELIAHLYPCNHDLVVAGALLHDIGKLEELVGTIGSGYTTSGRMLGHIILGMQYVQRQAESVPAVDEGMRDDLLHIILAHHTKEFGSPVNPATIEALIVHQADLAESRLTGYLDHCQRTVGPDGWTSFSPMLGGQVRTP
ncbi:MAG TPA: HD domain-containing protein [Ktedonobacteraceae bacterium]|nr:HD domain-containing protein [Ktedonobacteraceae bacterium]